jgi:uncharacterized metal-binding protein
MDQNCCAPSGDLMILSCSGGSNVGQLANQAAVELTQEGFGKFYCLAGIGARLAGFIQSAQKTPDLIVIDGCEIGCGKGIMSQAGVPLRNYLVLTDIGIRKNKNFDLNREDINRVKEAVKTVLQKENATACSWPPNLMQEVILPFKDKEPGTSCCV